MKETESIPSVGAVEVFNFSQEKSPVRVQLINNEPWFVAKDVCDVLSISNNRDAVSRLDDDEKATSVLPTQFGDKEMWLVNEGGLYTLIFQSRKPEAKSFRKWVTSEVLPSIRKKGFYGTRKADTDYFDARDVPYSKVSYNGGDIRVIEIGGEVWHSLNDVHNCIGSRTGSNQSVKRLNTKQTLARKIWLYGVTQPGWFVNHLGVQLILSASQKYRENSQLVLNLANMGE